MEKYKEEPPNQKQLIANAWSLAIQLLPTATALSLADTFINDRTESLDKADVESQLEDFTLDLGDCKFLPDDIIDELKIVASNSRNLLSND